MRLGFGKNSRKYFLLCLFAFTNFHTYTQVPQPPPQGRQSGGVATAP